MTDEKEIKQEEKIENEKQTPITSDTSVSDEVLSETKEEKKDEPIVEEVLESEKEQNLKPGLTVRVHQKIKETNAKGELKERIQVYEGRIITHKHGKEAGATITVRKISEGIGVEKIFPIHSPNIAKIEIVREAKVKRSKLYFLRNYKKRLKEIILRK